MSLVEITRFTDVCEADLAAAFLASHDIEVSVTERFQTTVDPLMQRALGIRLLGRSDQAPEARDLLARARAGEFATEEGEDVVESPHARSLSFSAILAVLVAGGGLAWGTSRLRRIRPIHWAGAVLIGGILLVCLIHMVAQGTVGSGLSGPSPYF